MIDLVRYTLDPKLVHYVSSYLGDESRERIP